MSKTKALYAIYKFDFHKVRQRNLQAEAAGIDGEKYLAKAQSCFDSLFDTNSIDNLAKLNKKGDVTRLPNDVMAKVGDIYIWRVNNSQMKEWWAKHGKDSKGIDKYEMQEIESNPYCNVLIDNRPRHCIMAIEKSSAWGSNPDKLRDMLLENFNRILADKFDLEMRIEARMNPTDIWEFMYERIYEHNDFIKNIKFSFLNPKRTSPTNSMQVKSARLRAMQKTVEISKALRGKFSMEFDQSSKNEISQKNKDLSEMVRLCGENGYDISIKFNEYKTYRINDYVKAFFPMPLDTLQHFGMGVALLNGKSELEDWFDQIEEQTKEYINESEVPKRRNKARK